ncbi:DUF943 family protein [Erwinia sp. 9145]|uniref:DUF943 family protein n=1 Tax=Erwinia sp. 9145 TaxID=1500895 RepID=UPI0005544E0D|nr:DUF943 family protein [Erwinia sp. 9145]
MRKGILIVTIFLIMVSGGYFWINNRSVKIIAVHHNANTVDVLVEQFPISHTAQIKWWRKNKNITLRDNNILTYEKGGPRYITIFAFGEGYQELGKKDRLCFDHLPRPKNCIDKDILMMISTNREGKEIYEFDYSAYMINDKGKIVKAGG